VTHPGQSRLLYFLNSRGRNSVHDYASNGRFILEVYWPHNNIDPRFRIKSTQASMAYMLPDDFRWLRQEIDLMLDDIESETKAQVLEEPAQQAVGFIPNVKVVMCPECGRVASTPEWCIRPICVHGWEGCVPEVWDGDDTNGSGRPIEHSPNEAFRMPGPNTWTAMVPFR
jgi:hypothetical protein